MVRICRLLWLIAAAAAAQDWPQFLGPTRNGVYTGPWSAGSSLAPVWKREVGAGFSAPVIAQGRLILFHRQGGEEKIESLDAATGKTVWSFAYPTGYRDDFGFDEGPRATPSIDGGRIYTFGAEGVLHGLDFASGRKVWSVDTHKQFGVAKGFFGAACSPLVEGNAVVLNIGGKGAGIVAFEKASGKVLWSATDHAAGYSAPVAATIGGARRLLVFTRAGLVDLDPASGKVRYEFPWRSRSNASVNAATPLVIGSLVFLSASYSTGATLLELGAGAPKPLWSSDEALSNHYSTSVHRDGYLYGYHGRQEEGQALRCVELRTGKVAWSVDRFGAGTITLAGDHLLVMRESGELVMAPATPKEFRPARRAQLLPREVRAYPALAGGRIYVRNESALVCARID